MKKAYITPILHWVWIGLEEPSNVDWGGNDVTSGPELPTENYVREDKMDFGEDNDITTPSPINLWDNMW